MASQYGVERARGTKEAARQLAVLRERWPIAFPVKSDEVRPLTVGAVGEIAAALGWSVPYTLGVLAPWKMAPVYCKAVLAHDHRIALDGTPAEPVDAKAKDSATKRLAHLAARHAAKHPPRQNRSQRRQPRRRRRCTIGCAQGYCAAARRATPLGHLPSAWAPACAVAERIAYSCHPASRRYSATMRAFLRVIGSPVSIACISVRVAATSSSQSLRSGSSSSSRNASTARVCVSSMPGTY